MAHGHGDIGTKMWAWTWLLGTSPYTPSFPNGPTLGLYLGPSFLYCPCPRALPGPPSFLECSHSRALPGPFTFGMPLLLAFTWALHFWNTPTLGLYLGPSFLECPTLGLYVGLSFLEFPHFGALLTCNGFWGLIPTLS